MIPDAPTWLSRAVADLECSGCGSPDAEFVGLYTRPGNPRRVVYRVCSTCLADRQRVAELVEARVRGIEAIEACTNCAGGAA